MRNTNHDDDVVVFVEVRYRSSQQFGGAVQSVNPRKQRKLIKAALLWLQRNAESTTPARIDVIAISPAGSIAADPTSVAAQPFQGYDVIWIENAIEY